MLRAAWSGASVTENWLVLLTRKEDSARIWTARPENLLRLVGTSAEVGTVAPHVCCTPLNAR